MLKEILKYLLFKSKKVIVYFIYRHTKAQLIRFNQKKNVQEFHRFK